VVTLVVLKLLWCLEICSWLQWSGWDRDLEQALGTSLCQHANLIPWHCRPTPAHYCNAVHITPLSQLMLV
jgi:hypothetical protein